MDFKIGIIGGTGLEDPKIFSNTKEYKVDTPFGTPSDVLIEGKVGDTTCILLSRHGRQHDTSPTNINYRANLWALMQQGAKVILSTAASGSLKEELTPGSFVFLDSFIDRTFKREVTFHDGKDGHPKGVCHIPSHPAYHEKLRQVLISSAEELKYKYFKTGTAVCIEGPRYSSQAESEVFRGWNADIINMTVCPEVRFESNIMLSAIPNVYLAKELGIPFATTAIVTDYDCWREGEKVSVDLVAQRMREASDKAKTLFVTAIKKIGAMHWSDEIMEAKIAGYVSLSYELFQKTARAGVMVDEHVVFDHLKY
uniref:S-methyl-5'-thioadenosine phosphorylase n=1 Tax=Elaeophora elaphi TaxID=1147741 RepID=A0A0R3RT62_9BILA